MKRHSDCEIEEFKIRRAMYDVNDAHIVNEAMRDILAGNFDSEAVHAVMGRRAGAIEDYIKVKDRYEVAVRAAIAAGAAK